MAQEIREDLISIHSLRKEGDIIDRVVVIVVSKAISIHSLRKEGDNMIHTQ